jgi:hypothetical protein
MSLSCLEFRQTVGAVPETRDAAVAEHRLQCRACAEFAAAQLALDRRLEVALRIPVPDDLRARVIFNQSGRWMRPERLWAGRWLAIAASLLLAATLGFALVQLTGNDNLPVAVVAHIEHEPDLLLPAAQLAEPVRVNAVLDRGGALLDRPLDNVTHAGLCPFHGKLVPHLVMRVDGKPVSVLLLRDEQVDAPQEISEDGYHGVVAPHGAGSIAIVGARPDLVIPVREQLEAAVRWRT